MPSKKNKKGFFSISQKAKQNVILMLADENFNNDIEKLKEENINGRKNLIDRNKKFKHLMNILEKAQKLRVKYKLSEPHFIPIASLVIFNENLEDIKMLKEIDQAYNNEFYITLDNKYGEKIMHIPIYPETTIEDIRSVFPKIKDSSKKIYGKEVYKKLKRRPKVIRNVEMARLKISGSNNLEIISKLSHRNIISSDETLIKEDIPIIINKVKKSVKKAKK